MPKWPLCGFVQLKNLIFIKSKNGHYATLLCFNFGFVDNAGGCLVFLLVND